MIAKLKKELISVTGTKCWKGLVSSSMDRLDYAEEVDLNLAQRTMDELVQIIGILMPLVEGKPGNDRVARMAKTLISDVRSWITAISHPDNVKAKGVKQMESLMQRYLLLNATGQRLYQRDADTGLTWCYYVNRVQHHYPRDRSEGPGWVVLSLLYDEYGRRESLSIHLRDADCRGLTPGEALLRQGYMVETPELRQTYEADRARFVAMISKVGQQYLCTGVATVHGVDGNGNKPGTESGHSGRDEWRYDHRDFDMVRRGEPSKVVLDVFFEEKEGGQDKDAGDADPFYWHDIAAKVVTTDGQDVEDNLAPAEEVDVPVHPMLIVFDLRRHLRMSVHVGQLSDYPFDHDMAQKLVLPNVQKELVQILMASKAGMFQDIVRGKSGGAVVLLSGAPGTGKTLTAEVYAESESRALYSIQCSQLGISPEDLEANLLKAFERARRWNAVMLLDEADVYVRQRSDDLVQNAIVGVFLRMLEYQATVMFLTTNRPGDVDDAIASRCLAQLSYKRPNADDQKRIWKLLAAGQGLRLDDRTIDGIVLKHGDLSGRDIKTLLKLAMMRGTVDAATVGFVKQFKPTGGD